MSMIARFAVVTVLVAACSTGDPAAPGPTVAVTGSTAQCTADSKTCGGACVSITLPEVGCADPACVPCTLAHASASCAPDGACAPADCENGFGDCNGERGDGCEADLTSDERSCGACGVVCSPRQVCRRSSCVDRDVEDARSWLETRTAGWCFETYNQMLNLCGDVDFCFDPRFMRPYPSGLGVDVAFDVESATVDGRIVELGGDCDAAGVSIVVKEGRTLSASGFDAGIIEVGIAPGKHLVSYLVSPGGSALYVDGLRAGAGGAPRGAIALGSRCGPGLVLGQRISFWWEVQQRPAWSHMAPFFFQLREGVRDADDYAVTRATRAGVGTVLLFDQPAAPGASWPATVGGVTAVGKNALGGDPELGAPASGPLPAWKELAECGLR